MNKLTLYGIFLAVFSASLAYGQPFEKNLPPDNPQFDYQASRVPDRIVMTFGEDSRSQRTVTWRTDARAGKPRLQWSADVTAVRFYRDAEEEEASSTPLVTLLGDTVLYHAVTLDGLVPGTQYVYRVGDGKYWSEWFDFRMPAADTDTFEFIYLGDAQNDLLPLWSRVIRAAHEQAPRAEFIMHAGDLVNHSRNDYEWGEWFEAGGHIFAAKPQLATLGNHEYVKDDEGEKTGISPQWPVQFNFPNNGPASFEDRAYYVDYQHCRIICLDSNEDIQEQAAWLEARLAEHDKQWVIVMFHHPVISGAEGRMNRGVMENWKPLLDKYRVDLVLQGHDHVYGRGNQVVSGLGKWDEDTGTVYVVSVAGRKTYDVGNHPWMQKKAGNLQSYQVIAVDGNTLDYKAYSLDGNVFDAFELVKNPGQKNELIEKTP